jgi:hypothetical protein
MPHRGGPGCYEWWYFDAHLEDGSSLVIVFYTKNPLAPEHPLEPFVTVQLDRPGHSPCDARFGRDVGRMMAGAQRQLDD